MRVAVFGMGSMGSRIARQLLAKGHTLQLWSRSGVPAELAAYANPSPRRAAEGVDAAIAMVTDDDASRDVWLGEDGALAGLREGAIAIESSTLTPGWVRALGEHAARHAVPFVDAPVVGSRPQAEQGALVALVSGTDSAIASARSVLTAYTSAIHVLGASPRATVTKLAVNTLFASQVAMLGELFASTREQGVAPSVLLEVLGALPVLSPAAKVAGAAIVGAQFQPLFPIALVAKDLRYALAEKGEAMPLTEALRAVYERAERSGLGAENITAIAKLRGESSPSAHPSTGTGETR